MAFVAGALSATAEVNTKPWRTSLKKMSSAVQDMVNKTKKGFSVVGKAVRVATSPLRLVGKVAGGAMKAAGKAAKLAAVPIAGLAAGMGIAVKKADDYRKALGNVDSILAGTNMRMEDLSARVLRLPPELGDVTSNMRALYQAISAGATTTESAMAMLESSTKLAGAVLIESQTAVDVLTTSVNAFSKSGLTAAKAADILTATIRLGKTSGPELAASLGKAIPKFAAAGLSMEELSAGVAKLTKEGVSTAEAVTALRGVMTEFMKPNKDLKKAIKEFGFETGQALLESEGLSGGLKMLMKNYGGNTEALSKLIPRSESLDAVLTLLKDSGDEFNSILADLQESGGAVDEAFANQERTFDTLKNAFSGFVTEIGTVMKPLTDIFAEDLTDKLQQFRDFIKTPEGFDYIANIFSHISAVAVVMKEALGFLVENIFGRLAEGVGTTNSAIEKLSQKSGVAAGMITGISTAMATIVVVSKTLTELWENFLERQLINEKSKNLKSLIRSTKGGGGIDDEGRADLAQWVEELKTVDKENLGLSVMMPDNKYMNEVRAAGGGGKFDGTFDELKSAAWDLWLGDVEEQIKSGKNLRLGDRIKLQTIRRYQKSTSKKGIFDSDDGILTDMLDEIKSLSGFYETTLTDAVMEPLTIISDGVEEAREMMVGNFDAATVGAYEQVSQITARAGGGEQAGASGQPAGTPPPIDTEKIQNAIAQVQGYYSTASTAMTSISQIAQSSLEIQMNDLASRREAELDAVERDYARRLQLAKGDEVAQKKILDKKSADEAAIKAKYADKEDEIKKKHFESTKALRISEVIMSAGQATLGAWSSAMALPAPASFIMAGLLTGLIATAAAFQTKAIAEQKYVSSRALGGMASGLTRVNEQGGEIISLPDGSQVIPHDISRQIARGVANPGPISITVNLDGAVFERDADMEMIGEAVADVLRTRQVGV